MKSRPYRGHMTARALHFHSGAIPATSKLGFAPMEFESRMAGKRAVTWMIAMEIPEFRGATLLTVVIEVPRIRQVGPGEVWARPLAERNVHVAAGANLAPLF